MSRKLLFTLVISMLILPLVHAQKPKKQMYTPNAPVSPKYKVDDRIDAMAYWRRMASLGLVPVAPETPTPPATYTSSKLVGKGVMTEDSEDVPVTTQNSTQSENSIFVNPQNPQALLQSNNSTGIPASTLYGANSFLSTDRGATWGGTVQGAGGSNSGDPATAVSLSGRYYVGFIHSSGGQAVAYSTNQGQSWTSVLVAPSPPGWGSLLDKNHMWIDNSPTSPYEGNLYDAWTNFGGSNDSQIEISRSQDEGLTWSSGVNISSAVNAGSHNQGVNIQTGPNGEVYVLWVIYDSWPQDEKALGFAKSLDGGATWQPAVRIINNIRGIRNSGVGKNHRVNGFPTMAVDISNGPNRGAIYACWTNIGTPGINTGSDADVYVMKSSDGGATWATPVKANQDTPGLGKKHYFPWITCDPVNGNVSVVYYDDRNVGSTQDEVYTSNSSDGGQTWWDLKVSDVAFTPAPIAGLADGYMGDYLANHARDGWVYPAWADNRLGHVMTFVSPFVTGPPPNQPWLVYNDHSLNDAAGNGNGLMDYGESAMLNLSIENQGDTPAAAVNVVLSTDNPYITITDNSEAYGDIASGAIANVNNAFAFNVANNIPDAEQVIFTIAATDANDSTYNSNFTMEAHAPAFRAGLITLNEVTGNGNNRLDPDETATISISTINTGDYKAYNVNGQLTTSSPYITINNPIIHWDSIRPGPMNAVVPVFDITVSPETPIGHYAEFTYQVNSEYHSMTKEFTFPVGLILEDWETGNFTNFQWQFAGSSTWQVTNEQKYEGTYSAVSGNIGDNTTSELKLNYNVMQADSITFYVKTSSEPSYDYLKFYINNTQLGQWSGEQPWIRVAFPVVAGQQTFRWVYAKDQNTSGGEDAAWVDYIILPPLLQTTAYAGPNGATCQRESYMLNGTANNYVSTAWTTAGDGSFDNPASLSCFYTPGTADIASGQVVLTLTVNGPAGELKTDQMILSISGQAAVSPLTDLTLCAGSPVPLSASASNFTSVLWNTSGTGTFTDPASLNTVYQPSTEDYTQGTVTLTLTAESAAPCASSSVTEVVTFLPLPTATLPSDQTICEGSAAIVPVSFTGTAPWSFEMNGVGVIETSDNPYMLTLNPSTTTAYSMSYVADANQCQNTVEGNFTVNVNAAPLLTLSKDSTICTTESYTLVAESTGDVSYNWTPGNTTSTSVTINGSTAGIGAHTFTVQVTNNSTSCSKSKTATVTVEDCTGISEMAGNDVVIYPNPSKGTFKVSMNSRLIGAYRLEIYDMNNKVVYSLNQVNIDKTGNVTVNTNTLSDGVYTLYLKNDTSVYSTKLIIKK
ncbi:MAG: T9SS type A sorting domain-containing protein [Chloroflexota bacterium]